MDIRDNVRNISEATAVTVGAGIPTAQLLLFLMAPTSKNKLHFVNPLYNWNVIGSKLVVCVFHIPVLMES